MFNAMRRREAEFLRCYREHVAVYLDRVTLDGPEAAALVHRDAVQVAWKYTNPRIDPDEIAGYEVFALDHLADRVGLRNGDINPVLG